METKGTNFERFFDHEETRAEKIIEKQYFLALIQNFLKRLSTRSYVRPDRLLRGA